MKRANIALLTTIFPASEAFLGFFFDSLKTQTVNNFDIIVINDGIIKFEKIKQNYPTLNIIDFEVCYSPAKNREFGIKKVIELGYEYIIFGDSDDFFSNNRIQIISELLVNKDIVINDLNIFNKKETKYSFLSSFIPSQKFDINYLLDKNVVGLSNMALSTKLLKNIKINFNNELIAVDWYFITIFLLQNPTITIHFTNKTSTYYRQYEQNTIGINRIIDSQRISLGLRVKLTHYKNIITFCQQNQLTNLIEVFKTKYHEIRDVEESIKDTIFLEKYISTVKKNLNKIFRGWWSEIITIDEFKKYENN